jgi:putative effector of murein hydrolase
LLEPRAHYSEFYLYLNLLQVIGFFVVFIATAYIARFLQLISGTSKRAITERAEEMGDESDAIPLADSTPRRQNSETTLTSGWSTPGFPGLPDDSTNDLIAPQRAQDPSRIRGTGGPPESDTPNQHVAWSQILQAPLPLTRPQRWAAFINLNFDRLTYLILFLFIGLPIYYSTGYAMPAQLTFNILAYFTALSLPARWRQFLHPVLVSSGITILGIWILGLIRGDSLNTSLSAYKTGTDYLDLWHGEKQLKMPGTGDLLVSVLDASIVALALPMFSYRMELKRHFFAIVIPNVTVSIGSLFGYPVVCYAIGISARRSLAFAGRSLTLALATPAVKNLGGDANTVAALAIMSGILGALIGSKVLDWLKIPEGSCCALFFDRRRYSRMFTCICTAAFSWCLHPLTPEAASVIRLNSGNCWKILTKKQTTM